jgi:hypothetical protein
MANQGTDGGVTIHLSKLMAGFLCSVVLLMVAGIGNQFLSLGSQLIELNKTVSSLNEWRMRMEATDSVLHTTVPRVELDLREKVVAAEMEQLRQRLVLLEPRPEREEGR